MSELKITGPVAQAMLEAFRGWANSSGKTPVDLINKMLGAIVEQGEECFRQEVHGTHQYFSPYATPNPEILIERGWQVFVGFHELREITDESLPTD